MDLTTIRLEVRERLGELSADFFSDAEIDRAINSGARRFNSEERWPWLVTEGTGTVNSGADTLILPDDVQLNRAFNLSLNAGGSYYAPLERVEPTAGFRMRAAYRTRTGVPTHYYLTKAETDVSGTVQLRVTVRLVPAANQAYSAEYQYYRLGAELSAGGDQPDMPDEYHDAVPAWATGQLWLKEFQISQKATEQFSLYGQILEQARNDVGTLTLDEVVAWGRDVPGERRIWTHDEWVKGRIPPNLG